MTEFLGRERYVRGERARAGSRNGHRDVTIKTTAGPVELARPKLRGTDEKFASRLVGKHVTKSNALVDGHRRVRAWPVDPRRRGLPRRRPRPRGDAVKADFWAILDVPEEVEPGDAAVAWARRRAEQFAATWQARYSGALACVTDDLATLRTFLRFPRQHWPRIRHTNLIERTFGESRRRVKVIGRLPGERSCLSLVWAVLDRASRG